MNFGEQKRVGDKTYTVTDFRHPKLKNHVGQRVEVTFKDEDDAPHWAKGRVARFNVGETAGPWVKTLGLYNARSSGSTYMVNADVEIESVRVIQAR